MQEGRLLNRNKDIEMNNKDISMLEERLNDIQERIKIKKKVKEDKLKAIKAQEILEEERQKAKELEIAENMKKKKELEEVDDPANLRLKEKQIQNRKKNSCQCCLIF